jgi:hypothetical protein
MMESGRVLYMVVLSIVVLVLGVIAGLYHDQLLSLFAQDDDASDLPE